MKNKMPSQQIEFMLSPIRDSIAGITYVTITSGEVVNFAGYETITFAVYETQDVLKARKTNEFAVCVVSIGRNLPKTIAKSKSKSIRLAQNFLDSFTLEKLNEGIAKHPIANQLTQNNESHQINP